METGKKEGRLLWLFAFCLTTFTLSGIVLDPGHQMPELGADGGKNLFTFLYHTLYEKGLWFGGMNYPAGEHIVYTDAQPIVSVILGYLPVHLNLNTALAIMWWLVAFSWMLGIIFCYRILRLFNVRPVLAGIFGGLIIVLSPQVLRLSGHYALSWMYIIPMLFYHSILYHRSGAIRYVAFILLNGLVATFLHPYFMALFLVWAGCYGVGYMLTDRSALKKRLVHTAKLLVAPVIIMLIFGLVMALTDPLKDRPVLPFGFLINCTHLKDIFASAYSPFWSVAAGTSLGNRLPAGGEGYVYLGLTVLAAQVLSLWLWVTGRKNKLPLYGEAAFAPVWLVIAAFTLLLGMGAPFTWHMEWLLNYLSFFRQFRTLGRFSWISYYILAVYAAVFINNYYGLLKEAGKQKQALLLLTFSLFAWEIEAWGYITHVHAIAARGAANYREFANNGNDWNKFLASKGRKAADFQSVLLLPFFENGSEKLWVCSDENVSAWGVREAVTAGLQLHLPIMDGMMSRTSWQVAFRQVRLAGGPFAKKDVLVNLSNKPVLLLCLAGQKLDPDQQYLLSAAVAIGQYGHSNVYVLYPERIRQNDFSALAAVPHTPATDTCVQGTGPWATQCNGKGVSCFDGQTFRAGDTVLAHLKIAVDTARLYEFSAWFRVSAKDYFSPEVSLEAIDGAGKVIGRVTASTRESTDNHGLWLRCNAWFTLPAGTRAVRCIRQYPDIKSYEEVGDILLRPADAVISTHQGNCLNNHWVGE